MCGIAGFWGEIARMPDAPNRLARMTKALAHRGPDGQDYWLGADVGLGHTRLAIIDLSSGDQPMWDAQEKTVIVFNGEIYNYRELRCELQALGFVFHTASDTEVIAAAIRTWGIEDGLRRLRGMFAFALYNTEDHTLLLARDRVGIKPLYYAETAAGVLFGSEQKALLTSDLVLRRVNPTAIHDYLAQGYAITPDTCWRDIQMLEPGTWLQLGPHGTRRGRYWHWQAEDDATDSLETATEKTQQTLHDALKCHLVSDVPLGAFLSGGLDSSLIVALLSQGLMPGLSTFSMGFEDPAFDESKLARQVAEFYGTIHHEAHMETNGGEPDLFMKVVEQYDEPFGDSSCLPTYMICGEMRKHVKVALSGDGGDEVLGGYKRYLQVRRLAAFAPLRPFMPLFDPMFQFVGHQLGTPGYQVFRAWRRAQLPRNELLASLHTYFSEEKRLAMYKPEFAKLALAQGPTIERFTQFVPQDEKDPIKQLMAAEFRLRLHADYLRKVDVASSAHGLEVRVPYLDNALLDLSATLPTRYKLSNSGETKIISRRLARKLLPRGLAEQTKKGFAIPLDRWMGPKMHGFLHDLLLSPKARINDWLKPDAIDHVWQVFQNPNAVSTLPRFQRYQRLFLLVSLELWLRRWEPTL
ncbi:MAG: asparagine synthase (glutamine-hydrolyzing) [Chloroflexi bacterium]|nr:asparagine synthase (glutamine-hydrolyzing) [Chloroflexota bacterium]